ncbi:hypothetical protein ABZ949_33590 [Micromonospora tulbaghiae]|uniref:hypothetical protein n=1 Tax=Micromonospora tulbaghiae TaxID=479978 RepID=UPI00340ACDE5
MLSARSTRTKENCTPLARGRCRALSRWHTVSPSHGEVVGDRSSSTGVAGRRQENFERWPDFVLPDRSEVTMTAPFMRACTELLVSTSHRRGAHAIGGMAVCSSPAGIPRSMRQPSTGVRADKRRKAGDGFDGSGVAHPGLVAICREEFDVLLVDRPNELDRLRDAVADLLAIDKTPGHVAAAGLRSNIAVARCYVDAWLGRRRDGAGNVAEDAATAEIARCQIWQWLDHATPLANDGTVTDELVRSILAEKLARLKVDRDSDGRERAGQAARIVEDTALGEDLPAFFTTGAYARYLGPRRGSSGSAC